jgi:ELWxxDGT repeat protein/uncharacterized repeat protein (TIGR03803 family)
MLKKIFSEKILFVMIIFFAFVFFPSKTDAATYTKRVDFGLGNDSVFQAQGSLALSGGKFYGMTYSGGTNDLGIIFEWDPVGNVYTKKIDLDLENGSNPYGSLVLSGGKFYGMTRSGGANDLGVIFEWDPANNTYTKKIDLDSDNGSSPQGSLALSGGKFYGMTYSGGTDDLGTIFEWDPAGNVYTKKINLSSVNGSSPLGSLALSGGKFYGMTSAGGTNDLGTIFEWDPAENVYTKKIDLSISRGYSPGGDLVLAGGKFYGMTSAGGANDLGTIFEWDPITNIYTRKISFNGDNGSNPYGSLTLNGNIFYGITNSGGTNGGGVIFEWNPALNVYNKQIEFLSENGYSPYDSLALNNNKFYGVTLAGGLNEAGVIFEFDSLANYSLNYIAGANGSISGDPSQSISYGLDGAEVTAVPNENYYFVDWSDGSTDNPRVDYYIINNISVTANFATNPILTYTAGPHGSILGNSPQTLESGGDGTEVTAIPDEGYYFVNWSDDSTDNPRTDYGVTENISVTANFAVAPEISLNYNPGSHGSILGEQSQTVYQYSDGTEVTAVPDSGYRFVNWSDNSTDNPRIDTGVVADMSVTANFGIMPDGMIKDVFSGMQDSNPLRFTNFNGALYFVTNDLVNYRESKLWKTDGTESGTVKIKDDIHFPYIGWNNHVLANLNGTLYFSASVFSEGYNDGIYELWKSDGTTGGTTLVKNIAVGTEVVKVGEELYFGVCSEVDGNELWKSDGTTNGTVLVKHISSYNGACGIDYVTNAEGRVYFSVSDGTHGFEPWQSDGTAQGTVMLKDINPVGDSFADNFFEFNGNVYFSADDGSHTEVWKTDGTAEGTVMLKDINSSGNSYPHSFINFNSYLYFFADDGTHGDSLWKSDGTAEGTMLVKNINMGDGACNASFLTDINGTLYFSSSDTNGSKLWKSDGTESGTMFAVNLGLGSSNVPIFTNVGKVLYIIVNDSISGKEPWKFNLHDIVYSAGTGGAIVGSPVQTAVDNSDGTMVTAVPNEDYTFIRWSDHSLENPRVDTNVTQDLSVVAQFATGQVVPNPAPENMGQKFAEGLITIPGEDPTHTTSFTFNVDFIFQSGSASVSVASGTVVTPTVGEFLDLTQLQTQDYTALVRTELDNALGAIKFGIPNLNLSFSQPVTATIPVGIENNGKTLQVKFQRESESAWNAETTCLVENGDCIFQTTHATTFVAEDAQAVTHEKAKIDSWKSEIITDQSQCPEKLKLTIKGKNLSKSATVKIGSKEASSVDKKSSKELIAKFCLSKLQGGKKTITVKNPDADAVKAKKRIDLANLTNTTSASSNSFNPNTTEGIKNIQRILVKEGYLDAECITGVFGPLTTEAVKKFQADHNIEQTGTVGPRTAGEMGK